MNADSIFQIGKEHVVCEDYALAGKYSKQFSENENIAYAIISDGCSASSHVDVGARLISLAARDNILWDHFRENAKSFGSFTIQQVDDILKRLPQVDRQCLDATLLVAYVQEKKLTVFMFGDGVLIFKNKHGISTVHINLTSGAPDYLSYSLDKEREKLYNELPDNKKIIEISNANVKNLQSEGVPFTPYILQTDVEEGDVISVISDGINSFRKSDNTPIDWKDLIEEFTGFKNFEGQFVMRRINAFKRKCIKENWHHLDDISIATIIV